MTNKKTILIDGRELAEKVKDEVTKEIFDLVSGGRKKPSLAIVLVGDRPDSMQYVKIKEREARLVGIDTYLYNFSESVDKEELIATINFLNNDQDIDSILIQLPLPERLNTEEIVSKLNPLKDADGFHPQHPNYVKSPLVSAIEAMLNSVNPKAVSGVACVLCNSEIFGAEALKLLNQYDFFSRHIILNHSIKESYDLIKEANVIISAIGVPLFINHDLIKDDCLIIDIGTNRLGNRIVGDVDEISVSGKAAYLSPVPGGVGPLTVAYLFKNVLEIYKNKNLSV